MVTAIIEVTTSIVLNNGVAGDVESTEKTVENDRKAWGMPPFANSNLVNLTEGLTCLKSISSYLFLLIYECKK